MKRDRTLKSVKRKRALTEEEALPGRVRYHALRRHVEHLHDARQLLDLVLSRENGVARVQLGEDAACRWRSLINARRRESERSLAAQREVPIAQRSRNESRNESRSRGLVHLHTTQRDPVRAG